MKQLPTLHILNGDNTAEVFAEANLTGSTLVWREVLSEGPALGILSEQEFWQKRQEFVSSTYQETEANYRQKVLEELPKLNDLSAFFEVVLWFDKDLMCQVNLLYLLHRLQSSSPNIVSVCSPAKGDSIAHLTPDQLKSLFLKRQQQTEEQLRQAHELWELYAGPDPMQLQLYLEQFKVTLPYMEQALRLHLQRFPDCQSGMGSPEEALLQLIQDGANTTALLMQGFRQQLPEYGLGDAQLSDLLARLQPDLVQETERLKLSFFGDRVLQGVGSFTPKPHWLGGVKIEAGSPWCYNERLEKLTLSPNSAKRK